MKNYKLAALTLSLIACNSAFAKGIEVSLSTPEHSITSTQDLALDVTFTNTDDQPLELLKWYIPTQDTKESLFKIRKDGYKPQYFGAHAKRLAPQDSDYLELQPNESVTYTVELTGMYDLSTTGSYDIQYAVNFQNAVRGDQSLSLRNPNTEKTISKLASNTVNVWVEGRGKSFDQMQSRALDELSMTQGISYSGSCSNSEKNTITSAFNAAKSITNNSVNYLNNQSANRYKARYSTWFGNYNSSRWNTVRSNFSSIKNALDTKPVVFDCSCNDNYYAYVYPTQPYKVYLCNAFWSAPTFGTDSKSGVIVHEVSHFNNVAGTDDYVYGQSDAKWLADNYPSYAIGNADTYEYFAENTPYLN